MISILYCHDTDVVILILKLNLYLAENEKLAFQITTSRSIEEPPAIHVRFDNGKEDDIELTHYKLNEDAAIGCNYIGYLKGSPLSSSVAATGCLESAEDTMDVTIISENNINKMFSVDLNGNATVIENPFEDGGKNIRND